jgi:hypothetical protein
VRTSALLLVPALAVTLAATAGAKGPPLTWSVCGARACGAVSGLSGRQAGSGFLHLHVPTASFFVVRMEVPGDKPGPPAVYLPRRGLWRVTVGSVGVWLDVPAIDQQILQRAVAKLRPHPAPPTWRAVPLR